MNLISVGGRGEGGTIYFARSKEEIDRAAISAEKGNLPPAGTPTIVLPAPLLQIQTKPISPATAVSRRSDRAATWYAADSDDCPLGLPSGRRERRPCRRAPRQDWR